MDMIRFHYSDLRNTEHPDQIKPATDLSKLLTSLAGESAFNSYIGDLMTNNLKSAIANLQSKIKLLFKIFVSCTADRQLVARMKYGNMIVFSVGFYALNLFDFHYI